MLIYVSFSEDKAINIVAEQDDRTFTYITAYWKKFLVTIFFSRSKLSDSACRRFIFHSLHSWSTTTFLLPRAQSRDFSRFFAIWLMRQCQYITGVINRRRGSPPLCPLYPPVQPEGRKAGVKGQSDAPDDVQIVRRIRPGLYFRPTRAGRACTLSLLPPRITRGIIPTDWLIREAGTVGNHGPARLALVQSQGNSDGFEGRTVARFVLSACPRWFISR